MALPARRSPRSPGSRVPGDRQSAVRGTGSGWYTRGPVESGWPGGLARVGGMQQLGAGRGLHRDGGGTGWRPPGHVATRAAVVAPMPSTMGASRRAAVVTAAPVCFAFTASVFTSRIRACQRSFRGSTPSRLRFPTRSHPDPEPPEAPARSAADALEERGPNRQRRPYGPEAPFFRVDSTHYHLWHVAYSGERPVLWPGRETIGSSKDARFALYPQSGTANLMI